MGKWKALEVIEPTIYQTKEILFPIKKLYWLRLALISIFIFWTADWLWEYQLGNPYNFLQETFFNPFLPDSFYQDALEGIKEDKSKLLISGGIGVALILIVSYIYSVFQFVFFQGIVQGELKILRAFIQNMKNGFSLLIFYILLTILTLIPTIIGAVPIIIAMTNELNYLRFGVIIGTLLVVIVILASGIISQLAVDFGVPLMYLKKQGIRTSLKEIYTLFKTDFYQLTVFTIVKRTIDVSLNFVYLIIMIPITAIWAVILGILLVFMWLFSSVLGLSIPDIIISGETIGTILAFLMGCVFVYSTAIAMLPINVSLRLYPLLFLLSQDKTLKSFIDTTILKHINHEET